jgi:hypothetical protein
MIMPVPAKEQSMIASISADKTFARDSTSSFGVCVTKMLILVTSETVSSTNRSTFIRRINQACLYSPTPLNTGRRQQTTSSSYYLP